MPSATPGRRTPPSTPGSWRSTGRRAGRRLLWPGGSGACSGTGRARRSTGTRPGTVPRGRSGRARRTRPGRASRWARAGPGRSRSGGEPCRRKGGAESDPGVQRVHVHAHGPGRRRRGRREVAGEDRGEAVGDGVLLAEGPQGFLGAQPRDDPLGLCQRARDVVVVACCAGAERSGADGPVEGCARRPG